MRYALLSALLSVAAFAQHPAPPAPPVPRVAVVAPVAPVAPAPPAPPAPVRDVLHTPGIPPALAQKLGISVEVQKKVRDLGFDANDAVIPLEADLKRAQLDLERTLSQASIDEAVVMQKLDGIGKAELAVRKNRMGLMLRIRKLVGPETWDKLQAALAPDVDRDEDVVIHTDSGDGVTEDVHRKQVRVIKHADGRTEIHETNEF